MKKISGAAWRCADPGVMFYDMMNKWHTCSNTEHIHATNPCSEYIFIDNTACNLASINLMKFIDEGGNFAFGLQEQTIFPEIETDRVTRAQGMDIVIVISGSKSREESFELLKLIGMPFVEGFKK